MLLKPVLSLLFLAFCSSSNTFGHNQEVFLEDIINTNRLHHSTMETSQNRPTPVVQHSAKVKGEPRQALLYNHYAPLEDFHRAAGPSESLERVRFPSAPDDIQADNLACFVRKHDRKQSSTPFPPPQKASNGLLTHWTSDLASALAIHLLQVLPGDSVLDLRAAVGDNSLSLAQSLWPYLQPTSSAPPMPGAKKGVLHSNEFDTSRNHRLASNLAEYLPSSLFTAGQVKVLNVDDTKGIKDIPIVPGGYDKAFVDVSRSGEQHTTKNQTSNQGHSASCATSNSPESVAETHVQSLITALHAVRYGGRVMYSTTFISQAENDAVVEAAILQVEKERNQGGTAWSVEVEAFESHVEQGLQADWAEKTEHGWLVLPDHAGRSKSGPLYLSLLTKNAA